MAYKANKIITNLYQGGLPPPGEGLKKAGIDVLVLCANDWQDDTAYPGLEVIKAPGIDSENKELFLQAIDAWYQAARLVANHVRAGHKVLVTCMQGLNRSGLVVALAIRILTGWPGQRIVQHIKQRREGALFNTLFVRYIETSCP